MVVLGSASLARFEEVLAILNSNTLLRLMSDVTLLQDGTMPISTSKILKI